MKNPDNDSQGMKYLESIPRRVVTLYLPLGVFLVVLALLLVAYLQAPVVYLPPIQL